MDQKKIIQCESNPISNHRIDVSNWGVSSNTFNTKNFQQYLMSDYSKERQDYAQKMMNQQYQNKQSNVISLLQKPTIYREGNPFESITLAFLTDQHYGFGRPTRNKGIIPF